MEEKVEGDKSFFAIVENHFDLNQMWHWTKLMNHFSLYHHITQKNL